MPDIVTFGQLFRECRITSGYRTTQQLVAAMGAISTTHIDQIETDQLANAISRGVLNRALNLFAVGEREKGELIRLNEAKEAELPAASCLARGEWPFDGTLSVPASLLSAVREDLSMTQNTFLWLYWTLSTGRLPMLSKRSIVILGKEYESGRLGE